MSKIEKGPKNIEEEESKEALEEKVEVEERGAPWRKLELKERGELISSLQEKSEINEGVKQKVDSFLKQEVESKQFEFAQDWFARNEPKIESDGKDTKNRNNEYVFKVATEYGAFDKDLNDKKVYSKFRKEMDNFGALRSDFGKESIPLDSQFLMLNVLNNKEKDILKDIERARQKNDPETVLINQSKLEEIGRMKNEIALKVSGRDFEGEARTKFNLGELGKKEDYVKDKSVSDLEALKIDFADGGRRGKRVENYFKESNQKWIKKGWLGNKFKILDKEDKIIASFKNKNQMEKFIRGNIEDQIKDKHEKEWEHLKEKERKLIGDYIEKEVNELGKSPEKAQKGIESLFSRVKERIYNEYIKKQMVSGEKTAKHLEKLEDKFEEEGQDPTEFIEDVVNREKGLNELSGDLKKDKKKITKFLGGYGFKVTDKDFNKFDREGSRYKKDVKKRSSFVEWILELLFN